MPQFDTFSFLTQIFWVFFAFFSLYSMIGFILLPGIAVTLKVRNQKLIVTSGAVQSNELKTESNVAEVVNAFTTTKTIQGSNFNQFDNSSTLNKTQYTSLFWKKLFVKNSTKMLAF